MSKRIYLAPDMEKGMAVGGGTNVRPAISSQEGESRLRPERMPRTLKGWERAARVVSRVTNDTPAGTAVQEERFMMRVGVLGWTGLGPVEFGCHSMGDCWGGNWRELRPFGLGLGERA